jgi:hypothetical protein
MSRGAAKIFVVCAIASICHVKAYRAVAPACADDNPKFRVAVVKPSEVDDLIPRNIGGISPRGDKLVANLADGLAVLDLEDQTALAIRSQSSVPLRLQGAQDIDRDWWSADDVLAFPIVYSREALHALGVVLLDCRNHAVRVHALPGDTPMFVITDLVWLRETERLAIVGIDRSGNSFVLELDVQEGATTTLLKVPPDERRLLSGAPRCEKIGSQIRCFVPLRSAVLTSEDTFETYSTYQLDAIGASQTTCSTAPERGEQSTVTLYTLVGNVVFLESEKSVLFWACPTGAGVTPDTVSIYRFDYEQRALHAVARFATKTDRRPWGRLSETGRFALIWRDIEGVDGLLELYDVTTRKFVKIGHDVAPGMAAFGDSSSEIFFLSAEGQLKRAQRVQPNIFEIQDVLAVDRSEVAP